MIRLFSILIVLIAVIITVWLVISNDGLIVIEWLDYYVETSFIFAVLIIFFCLLVFTLVFNLLTYLRRLPTEISEKYLERKNRQNLLTLIDGFSALAIDDIDKAKALSKKIAATPQDKQFKAIAPVVMLFTAQVSQASGNIVEAEKNYKAMLDNKKLEFVGLKGLYFLKFNQENYNEALRYAEEAYKINPDYNGTLIILFLIYEKLKMWEKAERMLKTLEKLKDNPRTTIEKDYERIYLAYAKELQEKGEDENAIIELEKLHKKIPANIEGTVLLAKLYAKIGKKKQGIKVLEKCWKYTSNREIINTIIELSNDEQPSTIIDKLEEYIEMAPDRHESYVALAEFLINENKAEDAKKIMDNFIEKYQANAEVAKVMAKISMRLAAKPADIYKWLEKI